MSLITDALKRAQNTTDQQPGQTPPPIITPRPENRFVEVPQERNQRPRSGLLAVVVLIAVLVVAGGAAARTWLLRKAQRERTPIPVAAKAAPGRTSETAETAKPATSPAAKSPVPPSKPAEAAPVAEKAKTEQIATQPPAPQPTLEPPKFKLQGVMIEGQDREAVINGVPVRVGDNLEGARVTAIDTRSVRLQFGDREIVLPLP